MFVSVPQAHPVRRASLAALAVLLASALGGCTKDPALLQPSKTGAVAIESFSGTLAQNATRFYSFTVPREGKIQLTLLTVSIGGVASDLAITVVLGQPVGTTCRSLSSIVTASGLTPQLTSDAVPTVYCAAVTDTGTLTGAADFVLNITRPR